MSTLRVDNIRGQTADGTNRYVVQVVLEHQDSDAKSITLLQQLYRYIFLVNYPFLNVQQIF